MADQPLLCADKELAEIYQRHIKTVYRLCYMYLQNVADTEDAVQSVFLKLINSKKTFQDHEYENGVCQVSCRI